MKTYELMKKVERLNNDNEDLDFDDTTCFLQICNHCSSKAFTSLKDLKKYVNNTYIDEVVYEIENNTLIKKDKFTYILNDDICFNIYKDKNY